jgi:heptosyltransferase-2
MSAEPARILVRLPNWTGDVVMATPALRALRARHPDAHITAHVRAGLAPLLAGLPFVDATLPVCSWRGSAIALWREGLALRDPGFDLGICLPDSWSSALLMRAAAVRNVAGYRRAGRGWLLDHAVSPRPEWGRRRLVARERYLLHLLAAIGCPEQGSELELRTTPEEEAAAEALLGPLAAATALVAIAPGASFGSAKRWAVESFAAVADALAQHGAAVVIVGSSDEAAIGHGVRAAAQSEPRDLCARTDLGALKAVLRRASVLVCNDAGARHVATALGTPAVVLFGPTALEKTDCNLATVEVVDADVPCRPCLRRECPIDHRCMTRIEPARVAALTKALL